MAEIVAKWVDGAQFVATGTGGHSIVMDLPPGDLGRGHGYKPSELLLVALAGCTGTDVVDILRKQRQTLTGLTIQVLGSQAADPPWTFQTIEIVYTFRGRGLNETLIQRAVDLSQNKYCSVGDTISGKAKITSRYVIEEAQ